MNTTSFTLPASSDSRPHLDHKPGPVTAFIFLGLLVIGIFFAAYSLVSDINAAGNVTITWLPYILL
ncbi:MAG: hypothetical protein PHY16_01185 [Methylobacter sp.]|nr:hypothetical protein [Methylobacter sp.]